MLRHAKTSLKIFVVVLPKQGLAGTSPATPLFGVTPTIELYYSTCYYASFALPVDMGYQKRTLGHAGTSQAFFSHDNNKDLETCFCMMRLMSIYMAGILCGIITLFFACPSTLIRHLFYEQLLPMNWTRFMPNKQYMDKYSTKSSRPFW